MPPLLTHLIHVGDLANMDPGEKDLYTVHSKSGSLTYQPGAKRRNKVHVGQVKLAFADLESIVFFYQQMCIAATQQTPFDKVNPEINVVVAGGAPGIHFAYVIRLFPRSVRWWLCDPRPFYAGLQKFKQEGYDVTLIQREFSVEILPELIEWCRKGNNTLFLSDIRTKDTTARFPSPENVDSDLQNQRRWLQAWKRQDARTCPIYSFLKFHTPYSYHKESYAYLRGTIFLQCYAPPNSSETRLCVHKADFDGELAEYNIKEYDNHMAFFNEQRLAQNDEDSVRNRGIDPSLKMKKDRLLRDNITEEYNKIQQHFKTRDTHITLRNFIQWCDKLILLAQNKNDAK